MNHVSLRKAIIGIIVSVAVLIIAQITAQLVGSLLVLCKIHQAVGGAVTGILYPIFTYLGLKLIIENLMKVPLCTLRIKKFQIGAVWAVTAVLLPSIVVIRYMLMQGEWVVSDMTYSEKITTAVTGIILYSIAAGIVEEMVFRGVIMGLLEKCTNIKVAVIVPSILFGVLHIIGNTLDFLSIIQLIIAGTVVGIMFSLIAYYCDNFWNNALVHALWNMSTIGIMHIGTEPYSEAVFTYVLKSKSMLITGGDFGIEASFISIGAYILFIIVTLIMIKRDNKNN